MSDLNAKIVADLKAQLAAAQEEANQQRTRAEAAEQELREERSQAFDALLVPERERTMSVAAWIGQDGKSLREVAMATRKIAAIRAHLAGVDAKTVLAMLDAERSRPTLSGIAKEGPVHALDHLARADLAKINGRLGVYAPALLAAAREALEP